MRSTGLKSHGRMVRAPHCLDGPFVSSNYSVKTCVCKHPGCTAAFPTKYKLRMHGLTHLPSHGGRPHKCDVEGCNLTFVTSAKLKRHKKSHQPKPKPVKVKKEKKKRKMPKRT